MDLFLAWIFGISVIARPILGPSTRNSESEQETGKLGYTKNFQAWKYTGIFFLSL